MVVISTRRTLLETKPAINRESAEVVRERTNDEATRYRSCSTLVVNPCNLGFCAKCFIGFA